MLFDPPLIRGVLLKRYKRFLADVQLDSGEIVTAHCANTGAMTGCAEPGFVVWLSYHNDPKRKLAYSWQLAQNHQQQWIGINTLNANRVVEEAVRKEVIVELTGYQQIAREVKYGQENSRIDLLLRAADKADCYVEIKSVTLLDNEQGYFPDAVTQRGQRHLAELAYMAAQGARAVLFFCVQHSGIQSVKVARHIDPQYAQALAKAQASGVEVMAYNCTFSAEKILLNQPLDFVC
ncbi:DNA/RNA nuclease SfsA [Bowmanella pacifica]|uniref:Sugar fermentation stimulation protein homolog n=1 Tax=Bowmanella pacifica TaxID=502051 RepID=A0A917Z2D9_9ALTE|nr:DNA/RNA nuclease SfsA [Bowmanella pacifica]GGO71087.1 sugar fermentation stimulation protein [Bowmanella pacifica]